MLMKMNSFESINIKTLNKLLWGEIMDRVYRFIDCIRKEVQKEWGVVFR
jgi:hypothetical protein